MFEKMVEPKIADLIKANMELGTELLEKARKGHMLTKAEREFMDALAELGGALMVVEIFGGI